MNTDPVMIVEAIKSVLRDVDPPVSLHEPSFVGREWQLLKDCLDSGYVSSVGEYVDRFEQQLAQYLGVGHVVAVVNGTAALHVSLLLAGVKPGDEVIVPTLTFVATANAVSYCGAIPHFADSEQQTLGLDPTKLGQYLDDILRQDGDQWLNRHTGRQISAIVPMHTFGHPVDMDGLNEIAEQYGIPVIEDAAESLGSRYKGRMTGTLSSLAALSFNGNKTITTGGGGAIVTNDEVLANRAKHITTTAKVSHRWEIKHDEIGFNYRMPNINAALGCAQLEQLPRFIEQKRRLTQKYRDAFSSIEGIQLFQEPEFAQSNYWLNALLLDEPKLEKRNELLEELNNEGIMARPAWTLMHKLPMYQECPRMDLSTAENLEQRLICIPSSPFLCGVTDHA